MAQQRSLSICSEYMPRLLLAIVMLVLAAQLYAQDEVTPATEEAAVSYRLGPSDILHINVFNQDDLTGEYSLDGSGNFSMHLIGQVQAAGMTANELETELVGRLKPDYLVNPRISVQVQNFRPYYIIGEISGSGAYAYVDGMTYLNAVAIAGGFTYRARKGTVYVVRGDDAERDEIKLDINDKVQPGDIIRIAERLF
jgi:protein involved in polysaccharide export with SLBB domain